MQVAPLKPTDKISGLRAHYAAGKRQAVPSGLLSATQGCDKPRQALVKRFPEPRLNINMIRRRMIQH